MRPYGQNVGHGGDSAASRIGDRDGLEPVAFVVGRPGDLTAVGGQSGTAWLPMLTVRPGANPMPCKVMAPPLIGMRAGLDRVPVKDMGVVGIIGSPVAAQIGDSDNKLLALNTCASSRLMPKVEELKGTEVRTGGAVPSGSREFTCRLREAAFDSVAEPASSKAVTATDRVRLAGRSFGSRKHCHSR